MNIKTPLLISALLLISVSLSVGCSNNPISSEDCDIKGNISSSGEKIYHVPGCASYDKTVISPEQGEEWFCSEADARDAGWRKAYNCP
jgi:hypothetical protein